MTRAKKQNKQSYKARTTERIQEQKKESPLRTKEVLNERTDDQQTDEHTQNQEENHGT